MAIMMIFFSFIWYGLLIISVFWLRLDFAYIRNKMKKSFKFLFILEFLIQ